MFNFLRKQNNSPSERGEPLILCHEGIINVPSFMSRGSQGMPFSIVFMFSHLSSASSTSDGSLFFLLRCRIPDKISSVIATMTMQNITPNIIIQMGTDGSMGGASVEGIFKNSRVWSFRKKAPLIRFLFILMAVCTSTAGRV